MGANESLQPEYDLTSLSFEEIHPVEGMVPLFRLKGQSMFVFPKKDVPVESVKAAERVQKKQHPYLCNYFGELL